MKGITYHRTEKDNFAILANGIKIIELTKEETLKFITFVEQELGLGRKIEKSDGLKKIDDFAKSMKSGNRKRHLEKYT